MKKIFTTILAASMMLIGTTAFAQASIGAGFVSSADKVDFGSTNTTTLSGMYVGGSYNVALGGAFGVAPGLYYTLLTKKDATDYSVASAKTDITEHYLSLPVMFNYGLQLGEGIVGRIYAGPTLAYGIASNVKYNVAVLGYSADKKVNRYDDSFDYGRFDVLAGGGVAIELYDMVRFDVGYDFGLMNRYTGDNNDYTRHRNQLHVGVAYMF